MKRRKGLIEHFAALEDPRQAAKALCPLPQILAVAALRDAGRADDFVEMQLWGNQNLAFLRRFQPYASGIPSHDTLGAVVAALDPELFGDCFTSWVEALREAEPDIIAIDGKTSRRTHARRHGREPLHLVSAWASRQRLVLGQQAVAAKSNEIAAIPLLLSRLELAGALVTIDAIGTQSAIAAAIRGGGCDYLLALKSNRPATCGEVAEFFADPPAMVERHDTTDGDHGRIEVRRQSSATRSAGCSRAAATPASRPFPTWR